MATLDKRARNQSARTLPPEIEASDIPRYVTYNFEVYNKETGATREFFKIEKHTKLKHWCSSKSSKVPIREKLAEAYKKLEEIGESFSHKPDYVVNYNRDPNILATEGDFTLKKDMIPKYVNFTKETEARGSKFEIQIPGKPRWTTSGAKQVTLANKFDNMKQEYSKLITEVE